MVTRVHFNHFVLATQFALSCLFDLLVGWPGLFSCEGSRVVLDGIIVTRFLSLVFAKLHALDARLFVLDLL